MGNSQLRTLVNIISIICAGLLFAAVMKWPIEYYTLLRIIVFTGALLVILTQKDKVLWAIIFVAIAILFNPIFPIYLYVKAYWLPLDIISGILFLLVALKEKSKKKIKKTVVAKQQPKRYDRDKIY
tara:strand:- start:3076 stop:3453 length:378 start_codon:yes stop_codon:yes gene_type:complete